MIELLITTPVALISTMFFSGWVLGIFSLILIVGLILEVANDNFGAGYFTILIYALAAWAFTDLNIFAYIWHNPGNVVGFIAVYGVIGAVYSLMKYRDWVNALGLQLHDIKVAFIKSKQLSIEPTDAIPEEHIKAWKDTVQNLLGYSRFAQISSGFTPGAQYDLIMNWIVFWPFSAVGLFIADPIRAFFTWLYETLVVVYRRIWNRAISKHINVSDISNLR